MDFRYTEEQQELISAAAGFFDGEHTAERMRSILNGDDVPPLWPQFAELGLLGVLADEAGGGLGQDLSVMAAMAEAAGYAGLAEPFVETAGLAVPLLERLGESEILSAVIAGTQMVGIISPSLIGVHDADKYDYFILVNEAGPKLVGKDKVELHPLKSIDPLRRLFKVTPSGKSDPQIDEQGAVLNAAQLCGLSRRLVDLSVEYAKVREQFGQPIGAFQAIKHHLATVHTQNEFTRPMVYLAAAQGGRAVCQAKISAIDTAMLAAETAIQVHGGMGYTYEVNLHMFMKRIWALSGEWGDRSYHMNKLDALIMDDTAALGPGTTFSP